MLISWQPEKILKEKFAACKKKREKTHDKNAGEKFRKNLGSEKCWDYLNGTNFRGFSLFSDGFLSFS